MINGKSAAKKIATLAVLTSLSLITFLIENLFPPLIIPGARMGLANIFSFVALIMYSPVEAFIIVAVRTGLGAIFAGNVSALMYSFTGGVISMAVSSIMMYTLYPRVSVMSVSITAAVAHNVTQVCVFALVTATENMFINLPYFVLLGILSGAVVGGVIMLTFKKIPVNVFERAIYSKTNKKEQKKLKAVKGKYYFGGVHPHDMKDISKNAALEVLPEPELVAISTSQSLGRPATPVVEAGQEVKAGEVIAKADGPISSDVFASISGTVTEIKDETGANGTNEKFIFIKADGKNETSFLPPLSDPSAEEIKARIQDAGIVGLGGAGFPTAVKVAPKTPVDTLILNGAECEPYLTCDHRLMLEKADEIARGARYIAKALGVTKIIIGIEANKPDCIKVFENYDDIQPVILKKQYPMGGEKQLIYVTTGRRVGAGKLPADVGVVVQNVATCYAVCEAVELGKPLFERVVTISGKAIKNPKNLWVKVGTPVKDVIDYCGGESVTPKKVVQGGPMTGTALASYDVYTHKTTSGILLMTEKEAAAEEPTPCINCGKCADVCPMHLMPMNTAFYSAAGDYESAAKYGNVQSCIECGACEYICPAKRPLIQAIRKTKAALRNKK